MKLNVNSVQIWLADHVTVRFSSQPDPKVTVRIGLSTHPVQYTGTAKTAEAADAFKWLISVPLIESYQKIIYDDGNQNSFRHSNRQLLKMLDQRWSDIYVVFTKILCGCNYCVW